MLYLSYYPLQGLFFALFFCLSSAWLNNLHILLAGRQIQMLKNIHGFIHGIIGYVISITHLKQFIMKYASDKTLIINYYILTNTRLLKVIQFWKVRHHLELKIKHFVYKRSFSSKNLFKLYVKCKCMHSLSKSKCWLHFSLTFIIALMSYFSRFAVFSYVLLYSDLTSFYHDLHRFDDVKSIKVGTILLGFF